MTGSIAWLAVACAVFVGCHVLLSGTPLRARLVGLIGETGFLAVFSVVALATLTWLVMAYNAAPHVELWSSGHALKGLAWLLLAPAVLLVLCANATPNPSAVKQEGVLAGGALPGGIFTITRHPLMIGIALWALAHVLANGDLAALLLFGSFVLLVAVGVPSQEAKKRATLGEPWQRFAAVTSILPFVAILQGRARLDLAGIGWLRAGATIVLYAALVALHPLIIGVSPLP